jgi:hypothetical protein
VRMRPIAAALFLIALACAARQPPPEPPPIVRPRFCSDICSGNLECRTRGNNCPYCTFGHCGLLPPARPAPLDEK